MHYKKNKVRKKRGKRGIRYWIVATTAMGVLIGYTVGSDRRINLTFAAEKNSGSLSAEVITSDETQRFDIPAGTLEEVLTAYEKIAGIRVIVPNENFKSFPSKGVTGNFSNEEALVKILTDTGLTYGFTASKTVTLRLLGPNETVQIVSEGNTISSPKYTAPLKDIPQTISVIDKKSIEEQGATTLRDVLQNVPGLTITAGEGGAPAGDNITLRGFSARNDIFVDGVRDLSPQSRDSFNLEQVEVSKGPTSAVSGRGSTGGTINLVSKTPSLQPYYNFELMLGSAETKRITGDINVPLAPLGLGDQTAFRVNLMAHDSNFPGRDVVNLNRWGVAPTLSFAIGRKTGAIISFYHMQQDNVMDYGIPWVPSSNNVFVDYRDRPAPVPRDTFYGIIDRDKEKTRSDFFTVQLTHTFNDYLSLRNQFRYGDSLRDSIQTPPRFASADSTVINRELRTHYSEDDVIDNQTDFSARFKTGFLKHALVSGIALTREMNIRVNRSGTNMATTLLNPNPNDIYPGTITVNPVKGDFTADSQAFYIFDTVSFGGKFDLIGGFRWDRFDVEGTSAGSGALVSKVDKLLSFRFGAVFRPVQIGSIYASVASSLNPSLEGITWTTADTTLDPEKTYNYELGTKWALVNNRILLTGAIFRVDKTNARTPGLPGEPATVLDGNQRVDGLELGMTGVIARGWNVLAAYTLLDSKIVSSNTAAEVGKRLSNTPQNSASIWSTYQTPFGITLGGGARFVGMRYGNTSNLRYVDSYWSFDAMASYRISKTLTLRVNGYNLGDAYYFDRLGGGHLVPAAGRSIVAGIGFNF